MINLSEMPSMTNIYEDTKLFCNIYHDEDDALIYTLVNGAVQYVLAYTGQPESFIIDNIANNEMLQLLIMQIVASNYDNRGYDSQQSKVNMMQKSILDMFSINGF